MSSERWKRPERFRLLRRSDSFPSRRDRRETSSSESSKSRRRPESENLRLITRRRTFFSSTQSNSDLRFNRMTRSSSKTDSTTSKREDS